MLEQTIFEQASMVFSNVIVWAIAAVGVFTYYVLIELCFLSRPSEHWRYLCQTWHVPIKGFLSSLPLLGLLGTISGLLQTFFNMSVHQGIDQQELISGGIAQALFTTQLGLILAVPALLIFNLLQFKVKQWDVKSV